MSLKDEARITRLEEMVVFLETRLEKLEAVTYQLKESNKDSTDEWLRKRFKKKEE